MEAETTEKVPKNEAPDGLPVDTDDKNNAVQLAQTSTSLRSASFFQIYMLGIALTVGGIHVTWNQSLKCGFAETIIGFVFVSIAFVFLICCSAEMTGLLPFSGGSYGFARVTHGPYIGFIIGCTDAFRCLVYVVRRTRIIGIILQDVFSVNTKYSPLLWLVFFIPGIFIDTLGRNKFWMFIVTIGVLSLLFTLLYFLVAAPNMDFQRFALDDHNEYSTSYGNFATILPGLARMYQGIATIPLACEEAHNPQTTVPRAMVATVSTVFILGLLIIFACCSVFPGVYQLGKGNTNFPLSFGFAHGLGIPNNIAVIFSFPAVYATCFGYAYSYGRIMCAMARSGLLPSFISTVYGERGSPLVSLVIGSLCMYVLMIILQETDKSDHSVSAAALIATVVVYWSNFASFIVLRNRFSNLQRIYTNPFGIPSAVVSSLFFGVMLTADLGFVDYSWAACFIFVVFILLCTIYYVLFASKSQCYSQEEQSIMLVLYVMKANKARRKKKRPSYVPYHQVVKNKPSAYSSSSGGSSGGGGGGIGITASGSGSLFEASTVTQQTSIRSVRVQANLRKVLPLTSSSSDGKDEEGKTTSLHETRNIYSSNSGDDTIPVHNNHHHQQPPPPQNQQEQQEQLHQQEGAEDGEIASQQHLLKFVSMDEQRLLRNGSELDAVYHRNGIILPSITETTRNT